MVHVGRPCNFRTLSLNCLADPYAVIVVFTRRKWARLVRESTTTIIASWLVFVSPVLRLEKDCNWTRLDRKKDRTAVLVFGI